MFGLPGNPSSALMCLSEYVLPALEKNNNAFTAFGQEESARRSHDHGKPGGLTHFVKVLYERYATPLRAPGIVSHASPLPGPMLYRIAGSVGGLEKRDTAQVDLLPGFSTDKIVPGAAGEKYSVMTELFYFYPVFSSFPLCFGGLPWRASGYLALMALYGFAPEDVKPTALLNLFVSMTLLSSNTGVTILSLSYLSQSASLRYPLLFRRNHLPDASPV